MDRFKIREILPEDNMPLSVLIHDTLKEFLVPEEGTARADKAIDNMYETYKPEGSFYFVAFADDQLVGGAGIAPLKDGDPNVCELQKMYILPAWRGRGLGKQFLKVCLEKARQLGYKGCYLETMPNMKTAQNLYRVFGFDYLESPMGCTGHDACPVWMYKTL